MLHVKIDLNLDRTDVSYILGTVACFSELRQGLISLVFFIHIGWLVASLPLSVTNDDVDHTFTYDPVKNAVAIEFVDDIHHKNSCTK